MDAVWSIAGHDPFTAAGIQADLRVAWHLGATLRTVIACFTAQNQTAMPLCEAVPDAWFNAQWQALAQVEAPRAIKLGLLAEPHILKELGARLGSLSDCPVICDPVLAASSGRDWGGRDLLSAYREYIFPRVSLLTPNRPEAERFLGYALDSDEALKRAGEEFRSWGVKAVLIKGGHGSGSRVVDYFDDGTRAFWLQSDRKSGSYRGTGCSLSTAIACLMADGLSLREAVVRAHALLQGALRTSTSIEPQFLDWTAPAAPLGRLSYQPYFPDLSFPAIDSIGFYPVVPDLAWLKRLLPTGIKTIQLRLKDKSRLLCGREIAEANALCRRADVRLFVNDYWQIACAEGVYGVHLGQEDLDALSPLQIEEIRRAGLRLGLSTHSFEEAARALSLRPSYIAFGPIFATTCKSMQFGPQGLDRISHWKKLCAGIPLVAIGGLKLEHAAQALALGADGVAVVSDVLAHSTPEQRTKDWLRLFP